MQAKVGLARIVSNFPLFVPFFLQSGIDRLLIYITLYITECLKKLQKCPNKAQAQQDLYSLAIARFDIPGDAGFPLNSVYPKPSSPNEAGKWNVAQMFANLTKEVSPLTCINFHCFHFQIYCVNIWLKFAKRQAIVWLKRSFQHPMVNRANGGLASLKNGSWNIRLAVSDNKIGQLHLKKAIGVAKKTKSVSLRNIHAWARHRQQ